MPDYYIARSVDDFRTVFNWSESEAFIGKKSGYLLWPRYYILDHEGVNRFLFIFFVKHVGQEPVFFLAPDSARNLKLVFRILLAMAPPTHLVAPVLELRQPQSWSLLSRRCIKLTSARANPWEWQ